MSRLSVWKLKPGGGRFLVTTITEVVCEGVGPAPKRMVDRLVQDSNLSAKKRGNIPVDF